MNALLAKIRAKLARPPRELAMFFVTSVGGRGVGIVCQLLQVPLAVKTLGAEAFGLWMAMTSVASLAAFADFGMGLGVQNRLAELFARDREPEARVVFGSALVFMAVAGASVAGGFALAISGADFAALFNLADAETIGAAPRAALALALIFGLGLPAALAQRLSFACGRGWAFNVSQAAGNVLALGLVALGAARGWGLAGFVAAAQGSVLVANLGLLFAQTRSLGWLSWRVPCEWSAVRGLLGVGACFGVQQVLGTVLFALPQIVISTSLGAAAVAPYNILQRIFNLFSVVQNAFMLPLWPAYSRAKARGEFDWMRGALRRSLQATAGICVLPMVVGAAFAPWLVRRWVGHDVEGVTWTLVAALCSWNALVALQQPFSFLLAGVSEIRRVTVYSAISAALGAGLMYALVGSLGAPGVVLGLVLGSLPFNFLGSMLEARRYLRAASASSAPAGAIPSPA